MELTRRRLLGAAGASLGLRLGGLGLAGLAWWPGPAAARRVFPADGAQEFLALQHDRVVVGRQRLSFSRGSGDLVVRQDMEFQTGPRRAPSHSFSQHSEEVWDEGWLHAVICDTESDGERWKVRAERRDGVFGGQVNGFGFTVSGYAITSTLWHRDTPTQQALFDVTDARVKLIRGRTLGEEKLALPGGIVPAKRYAIRGEINRDVWYDGECRLVRSSLPLPDGSIVVFELS